MNPRPEQERLIPVPPEEDAVSPDDDEMLDLTDLEASLAAVAPYLMPDDEDDEEEPDAALVSLPEADDEAEEAEEAVADEPVNATPVVIDPSPADLPLPPRPEATERLIRLTTAGQAMRRGVREEIHAAADHIFELAVTRARAELEVDVRRFEEDIRREFGTLRDEFRRRATEEPAVVSLETRLDQLWALVAETREGVLALRKRYLPGSPPAAP